MDIYMNIGGRLEIQITAVKYKSETICKKATK